MKLLEYEYSYYPSIPYVFGQIREDKPAEIFYFHVQMARKPQADISFLCENGWIIQILANKAKNYLLLDSRIISVNPFVSASFERKLNRNIGIQHAESIYEAIKEFNKFCSYSSHHKLKRYRCLELEN